MVAPSFGKRSVQFIDTRKGGLTRTKHAGIHVREHRYDDDFAQRIQVVNARESELVARCNMRFETHTSSLRRPSGREASNAM